MSSFQILVYQRQGPRFSEFLYHCGEGGREYYVAIAKKGWHKRLEREFDDKEKALDWLQGEAHEELNR